MKDKFLGDRPYPQSPGYKVEGTSKDAAKAIGISASRLRELVLETIVRNGPAGLTADEVADAMGRSVLSVRPRLSELFELNKIEKTGQRRRNASGMKANVWRAR